MDLVMNALYAFLGLGAIWIGYIEAFVKDKEPGNPDLAVLLSWMLMAGFHVPRAITGDGPVLSAVVVTIWVLASILPFKRWEGPAHSRSAAA